MSYKYLNTNPNNANISDCAIRCISTIEDISWSNAYKKLSNFARKRGLMISSVEAVEEYLDTFYDRVDIIEYTVGEFIDNHEQGTYAITMPNHITALVDGINYDTFDSSRKNNMVCVAN